jgi:hypothetical protein
MTAVGNARSRLPAVSLWIIRLATRWGANAFYTCIAWLLRVDETVECVIVHQDRTQRAGDSRSNELFGSLIEGPGPVLEGFPRLWIEDQGDAALALDPFERKLVIGFGSHEPPILLLFIVLSRAVRDSPV